jgi:hypothetical protein
MTANRAKVLYYTHGVQVLVGLVAFLIGWRLGHTQFHLLRVGLPAQGRIVAYQKVRFRSRSVITNPTYFPIVEFQVKDQTARFTNWLGSSFSPTLNQTVPVLYDSSDLSVAMIDRPVMNWIPWGPIALVGIFLLFVGVKGLMKPLPVES